MEMLNLNSNKSSIETSLLWVPWRLCLRRVPCRLCLRWVPWRLCLRWVPCRLRLMSVPWRLLLEKKSGDSPQVSDSSEFFTLSHVSSMETSSRVRLKLSSVETSPQVSSLETSPQTSIWRLRLMWIQIKWLCYVHPTKGRRTLFLVRIPFVSALASA